MVLLFGAVACEKIELPSNDKTETEKPADDDTTGGGDDSTGNDGGTTDGDDEGDDKPTDTFYISVADLDKIETDKYVALHAYIVGSVKGSSMKGTIFGTEGAVASNIAVADSPDETDYTRCAPIQLPANSDVRLFLNLQDNPENLGAEVILYGKKTNYFRTSGLKPCEDFMWPEEYDDQQ